MIIKAKITIIFKSGTTYSFISDLISKDEDVAVTSEDIQKDLVRLSKMLSGTDDDVEHGRMWGQANIEPASVFTVNCAEVAFVHIAHVT